MNNQNNQVALIGEIMQAATTPAMQFNHDFKGFGTHRSTCNVKIWVCGEKAFVLFTDLGRGTSVTNAAEQLVEEITALYLPKFKRAFTFFAETYQGKNEGVDLVCPEWAGDTVQAVSWVHIGKLLN